jgi:hypothetical protein
MKNILSRFFNLTPSCQKFQDAVRLILPFVFARKQGAYLKKKGVINLRKTNQGNKFL